MGASGFTAVTKSIQELAFSLVHLSPPVIDTM